MLCWEFSLKYSHIPGIASYLMRSLSCCNACAQDSTISKRHPETRRPGNTKWQHGANLSQVFDDLVNRSSIRKHAEQLLKFPPIPTWDAVASSVLQEFSVKPEEGRVIQSLMLRLALRKIDDWMREEKAKLVKKLQQRASILRTKCPCISDMMSCCLFGRPEEPP